MEGYPSVCIHTRIDTSCATQIASGIHQRIERWIGRQTATQIGTSGGGQHSLQTRAGVKDARQQCRQRIVAQVKSPVCTTNTTQSAKERDTPGRARMHVCEYASIHPFIYKDIYRFRLSGGVSICMHPYLYRWIVRNTDRFLYRSTYQKVIGETSTET